MFVISPAPKDIGRVMINHAIFEVNNRAVHPKIPQILIQTILYLNLLPEV